MDLITRRPRRRRDINSTFRKFHPSHPPIFPRVTCCSREKAMFTETLTRLWISRSRDHLACSFIYLFETSLSDVNVSHFDQARRIALNGVFNRDEMTIFHERASKKKRGPLTFHLRSVEYSISTGADTKMRSCLAPRRESRAHAKWNIKIWGKIKTPPAGYGKKGERGGSPARHSNGR